MGVFPGRGSIDEVKGRGTVTRVASQDGANGEAKGRGMATLHRVPERGKGAELRQHCNDLLKIGGQR